MSGNKKMSGRVYFYTYIAPKIISIGASVVILGALFKLMHWPMAGLILTIGLTTEAGIFLLTAFAPIDASVAPDWSKLTSLPARDESVAAKLAQIEAQIAESVTPDKVQRLGEGMKQLAENVSKMSNMADASVATNEYSKNIKLATNSLIEMNKSYASTMGAVSSMADASKDAKAYHIQLQGLTKTLSSLNAAYEMELQDSKKYVSALNKYYGGVSVAMQNVVEASKDAEQFKVQLSSLTSNLTMLNKVYGSMLTAMKNAQS